LHSLNYLILFANWKSVEDCLTELKL